MSPRLRGTKTAQIATQLAREKSPSPSKIIINSPLCCHVKVSEDILLRIGEFLTEYCKSLHSWQFCIIGLALYDLISQDGESLQEKKNRPMPPTPTAVTALVDLPLFPYLDALGSIPQALEGKIGVYAIFDQQQALQLIAFSRNVFQSLKQHLVRCPDRCYWFKVKTVDRPSRTVLNEIQAAWIAENGSTPPGNGPETALWQEAIDIKPLLTPEEQTAYTHSSELEQAKLLKRAARRIEAQILKQLQVREVKMDIRFNPKQKELGRLDLK